MKTRRSRKQGAPSASFIPPPGAEGAEASPLDRHFARQLVELNGAPAPELALVAETVSAWRAAGHICVPLGAFEEITLAEQLRATRVVGAPGEFKPLILDGTRLYLQRYWRYEQALARAIAMRAAQPAPCDATLLQGGLERMFAGAAADDQRLAAQTAVEQNLTVITGGPGTGKTRTVVVLLALLVEQFAACGRLPRIALAAPTGKAGARLKEAIRTTAVELRLPETIRSALPAEATTLHRLLGTIPDSPYFRHDASRPLAIDAVIVDEASMVDLALMAKLFDAVPAAARLILLGDKDQLASVEAGYVLGDICQAAADPAASLHRHVVELRKNYRFEEHSGIQQLSTCVNAGDGEGAFAELCKEHADVASAELPIAGALMAALREPVLAGFRSYLEAATPEEALQRFSQFRILAALRRGPFGVENLNRSAEQILAEAGLLQADTPHYHGRPIIIRQNERNLRLFNGDVGVLLRDEAAGGDLRAFFSMQKVRCGAFSPDVCLHTRAPSR
jgi:exodeoxyribonuclease V alpha subunit